MQTTKFNEVEKLVHKTIDRLTDPENPAESRIFQCRAQVALDIFRDIAQTIDDAIITRYEGNLPIIGKRSAFERIE